MVTDRIIPNVKPNLKVIQNPDGTYSISIKDVNSDAMLAAVNALITTGFLFAFWSDPQLGVTIPAVAGTLTLPGVVVAGLPAGAVVTRAKAILLYRVIDNLNVALNKLDGATVALTSQVVQINKGGGAWSDAITFLDDQLSIAGSTREGGSPLACAIDLAATVTGNDTYNFRWLLAKADLASLYLQGVHMLIQLSYSL